MIGEHDQRTDGRGRITVGGVIAVIVCSMLCSILVFIWTVERSPLAGTADPMSRSGRRDPDPGWGNEARALFAGGRYEELIELAHDRMRTRGEDPEAWLFAGFAYDALAERPGMDAFVARTRAGRVWRGLLRRTEPWREYADPDGLIDWESYQDSGKRPIGLFARPYYAGWALTGLGHHTEAHERFGRFLDVYRRRVSGRGDDYNRACYLALAGEGDAALTAWIRVINRRPVNLVWAAVDPDLELLHGDPAFEWPLRFAETLEQPGPTPEQPIGGRDGAGFAPRSRF
ncbi:MAG: hypothetical protein K8E66_14150 [Phycisphaerales bacterium]|nr:hypothetical protein [Phycisphaerales bacterium]